MSFFITDRLNKDRRSKLQKLLEKMDDVGDDEHSDTIYNFKEPIRLQDQRRFFFQPKDYQNEQVLYYITHNFIIDIKLEIQSKSRNEGKRRRYAKTKESDKVNSYSSLKRKYRPSYLSSIELQYRKLIFQAFSINGGIYDSVEWVHLIIRHQLPSEIYEGEYGELKEEIKELVSSDGEFPKPDKTSNKKKKSHPNSVEQWMDGESKEVEGEFPWWKHQMYKKSNKKRKKKKKIDFHPHPNSLEKWM